MRVEFGTVLGKCQNNIQSKGKRFIVVKKIIISNKTIIILGKTWTK
jgi:hypothetical protein